MSVHLTPSGVNPEETTGPAGTTHPTGRIRAAGLLLAAGAAAWTVGTAVVGDQIQDGVHVLDTVTGMAFLVGVAALAATVLVTRASGAGVDGRAVPVVTLVVLAGAFAFNAASFGYTTYEQFPLPLQILDICWPLGQLLVLVMGVAVAVVGRYRGFLRWQPLLCGLWLPVSILGQLTVGPAGSVWVSAAWLLLAHVALGVHLALRPADALPPAA